MTHAALHTILFDLDDTLLQNDGYSFFMRYVQLLAPHLETWMPAEAVMPLISQATGAMLHNQDPAHILLDCFWENVQAAGYDPHSMNPAFDRFYATDYEQLGQQTTPIPGAREAVMWAIAQGYQVVIATSPLFPLAAIQRRLAWAGVEDLDFALITSCDTMHFAKPHLAYYHEILQRLGRQPQEVVMVGNDLEQDMVASRAGIYTYWVGGTECPDDVPHRVDGCGPIDQLAAWIATLES